MTQMPFPHEPQKFPAIVPQTQIAAMLANARGKNKQHKKVYVAFKALGRATDGQFWTWLNEHGLTDGSHNSIGTYRARRVEMVQEGILIDSGEVYEGSTVWMIGDPDDPEWLEELKSRRESLRLIKRMLFNRGPVGDDLAKRLSVYIAKNYEE